MGLTSSIGNTLNNVFGVSGSQASQFQYNKELLQMSQDWQEKMSNTAYQRSVNDLTQAGLNPLLAYASGGASTGSASTPGTGSGTGSGGQAMMSLLTPLIASIVTGERDRNTSIGELNSAKASATRVNTAQKEFDLENQRDMLRNMDDVEKKDYQRLKYGNGYGSGPMGWINQGAHMVRNVFGFGSGNSARQSDVIDRNAGNVYKGYQNVFDHTDPDYPGSERVYHESDLSDGQLIWRSHGGRIYTMPHWKKDKDNEKTSSK